MKKKTKIFDIAEKTGFSVTTVSRVLNGKATAYRISQSTKEKIQSAAKELNYTPNQSARSLRTGISKTIALILPSIDNPFFSKIAHHVNAEIRKYGFYVIISDTNESVEIEQEEIRHLLSQNIDGLIISPCGDEFQHLTSLANKGFPLVCIDRYFEKQPFPYVSSDNYEGAYKATQYLISQGHKLISCIQGIQASSPNINRVKGFTDAMNDAGLSSYTILGTSFSEINGYNSTKYLLQQSPRPTAIFTLNNMIAVGCLKAFREEQLEVPKDISLITFDDNTFLDYTDPPITRINQQMEEICKKAAELLINDISKSKIENNQILFKTQLSIKKSVRRITPTKK